MTNETLAAIDELQRIPSPGPRPVGLACDGTDLWVSSGESERLYGVRSNTGDVFEEATPPGLPIGITVTGDALRLVTSEGDDDHRFIRRYVIGHGFKTEGIACPDDTGSFIAYDGDRLFLSQRFNRTILELDDAGAVLRTIATPRQVTGMVVVHGRFFLMTTGESEEPADYRLVRLDARQGEAHVRELARIPFVARSLAFDGTRFWTNDRDANEMVAFAAVGI